LDMSPDHAIAHYHLGHLYLFGGDYARAYEHLGRAHELGIRGVSHIENVIFLLGRVTGEDQPPGDNRL